MGFTPQTKDEALNAVLGKPLFLALFTANGEDDAKSYKRQSIEFAGENGTWLNVTQVRYAAYSETLTGSVTTLAVFDKAGSEKWTQAMVPVERLKSHRIVFDPGDIVIKWPD